MVTCALEFTQLIQTNSLNRLREYFVVHALIGSSFNWMDIPFYGVGGGIGWLGLRIFGKKNNHNWKHSGSINLNGKLDHNNSRHIAHKN